MKFKLLLLLGVLSGFELAMAQTEKPAEQSSSKHIFNHDARRWYVGLQGGSSLYGADADKITPSWSAGVHVQYNISHTFALRAIANYGNVSGEIKTPSEFGFQNFKVNNTIIDAQGQLVFNLGNLSFIRKYRRWGLYLYTGAGMLSSDAKSDYRRVGSTTDTSATWKESLFAISAGGGLRFNVNNSITLGLDLGTRWVASDSLDMLNAKVHNNRRYDLIMLPQLMVSYKLGKKEKEHLDWINPVASMYDKVENIEKKVEKLDKDSDNDGVSDRFDKEPNTPAGTKVYGSGEALDSDVDGVPDYKDEEPNSPKGATVDPNTGKALDTDEDGVADVMDLSPNTDSKKFITNHQGIPIMTREDADAVLKGGRLGGAGFLPAVFFASDEVIPYPIHLNDLQQIAMLMESNKGLKLEIIGHTDTRAGEQYNEQLAKRRAESVKDILVTQFGADASRLEVKWQGEKNPITKGQRSIDHQANRRVQFFIKK